jgi:hypothetical protein
MKYTIELPNQKKKGKQIGSKAASTGLDQQHLDHLSRKQKQFPASMMKPPFGVGAEVIDPYIK